MRTRFISISVAAALLVIGVASTPMVARADDASCTKNPGSLECLPEWIPVCTCPVH